MTCTVSQQTAFCVHQGSPAVLGLVPLFAPYLEDPLRERIVIAGMDERGVLVCFASAVGGDSFIDSILPCFRSILGEHRARDIVIAHHHPKGRAIATPQDSVTTDRLTALARLGGAMLLDHLIFGEDGIYSYREKRLFPGYLRAPSK
jgi:hypothetical protein